MTCSDSASRADVASPNSSILGSVGVGGRGVGAGHECEYLEEKVVVLMVAVVRGGKFAFGETLF